MILPCTADRSGGYKAPGSRLGLKHAKKSYHIMLHVWLQGPWFPSGIETHNDPRAGFGIPWATRPLVPVWD